MHEEVKPVQSSEFRVQVYPTVLTVSKIRMSLGIVCRQSSIESGVRDGSCSLSAGKENLSPRGLAEASRAEIDPPWVVN